MSCNKRYCGCCCKDCLYARRNRSESGADARHCHTHSKDCHWKGCSG